MNVANGKCRFIYWYDGSACFGDLFGLLREKGIDVGNLRDAPHFIIKGASGSTAMDHENVSDWGTHATGLDIVPYLKGGAKRTTRTMTMKKTKDRGYASAMKEFAEGFQKVPATPLVPFRAEAEDAMNKFYNEAMNNPEQAFQNCFSCMTFEQLASALEKTSSSSGGGTDDKLKRLSTLMFGNGIQKAKEVHEITEGLLEGAELTACTAFHNSNGTVSLASLRSILKTCHDKKLGAIEASQMET
eukprot:Skav213711  [mRNA]  locus=scaffold549:63053:63784:- [translate_table: standard]